MSTPRRELSPSSPLARPIGLAEGWLLIYLAGPGIVAREGLWPLAPLGVALWAIAASRPARGAFWIEALVACIAWCGICSWAALVHWTSLLFIGPGFGLYFAGAGVLLRRLARRLPLAVAAPAAWMAIEALRSVLEPPFGLNWMRLGVNAHDLPWLAGSARVWGVFGLSYVLAAAGGGLADGFLSLRMEASAARSRRRWAIAAGGGPVALAVVLAFASRPPATEIGPRILLVQPGIPQQRKMKPLSPNELFLEGYELTARGLEQARAAGGRAVDLVAWGESMLDLYIIDPALPDALSRGARPAPWVEGEVDQRLLEYWGRLEDEWVRRGLLRSSDGKSGILPEGAAFVSGALVLTSQEGLIGRQNAVALWSADGARSLTVGKKHLVPGAETMLGLERYRAVRETITALAGYVPDLLPHLGTRRIAYRDRSGRELAFGASVCFDNAYDGAFVEPILEGPLDFHLIASNEAWFLGDQENDQMMAFSRLAAIATARSVVRATNSGISAVIDPRGIEVTRLVVDGRDREVAGTLLADVPIPVQASRESHTVYVRSWRLWPALALLWPVLLILAEALRRPGYRGTPAG